MTERKVTTVGNNDDEILINRCPVVNDGTCVGSSICQWCIHFMGFRDTSESVVLCEADDE
jgi:hypothetical protein